MAKVNPRPPEHILRARREPRYIIDPRTVSEKDDRRVRKWAGELISKYESNLNPNRFANRKIVKSGEVEPEAIDIKNIYPFQNLHWVIFRNDQGGNIMWSVMLLSRHRCLFISTFAKI